MRSDLIKFVIHQVLSDKNINKEEVDLIYQFGSNIGYSEIEIANAIAMAIQDFYVPKIDSIC